MEQQRYCLLEKEGASVEFEVFGDWARLSVYKTGANGVERMELDFTEAEFCSFLDEVEVIVRKNG